MDVQADIHTLFKSDFYQILNFKCYCRECGESKPEYSQSFKISFVRTGYFDYNVFRHTLEAHNGRIIVTDIDIHFSPFTNTLAIRRLKLKQGIATQTQVVFINVPDLSFEIARQQYTLIEDNTTVKRCKYESLTSGFKTELPVDDDGLLIKYPQYFERAWPR